MLTTENKLDLKTVIRDYWDAIAAEDNDRICDTALALDATVGAMDLETLDPELYELLLPSYADECDFDDAVDILHAATIRVDPQWPESAFD